VNTLIVKVEAGNHNFMIKSSENYSHTWTSNGIRLMNRCILMYIIDHEGIFRDLDNEGKD